MIILIEGHVMIMKLLNTVVLSFFCSLLMYLLSRGLTLALLLFLGDR